MPNKKSDCINMLVSSYFYNLCVEFDVTLDMSHLAITTTMFWNDYRKLLDSIIML